QALPAEQASHEQCAVLVERAGGNPLFLELIIRAAREAPDPAAVLAAVPDTLYGLVQARLDSLPAPDRRTLQPAAVLGKNFAERWLAGLLDGQASVPPENPPPWRGLEVRDLLVEERPPPQRELAFRYGAMQEVLYESLLQAQRRKEHARAAPLIAAEAATQPALAALVAW